METNFAFQFTSFHVNHHENFHRTTTSDCPLLIEAIDLVDILAHQTPLHATSSTRHI